MSLVFACIAPHGDVDLAPELRAAMEELGRRSGRGVASVAVVVTPHSVHMDGHFAVVTAAKVGEWETDRRSAAALLEAPLPILGVSYGGNDPRAEFPLDWGTEVPLEFLRPPRVVVVSPARDRPLEEHLRLGEAIAGCRAGSRWSRAPTTATRTTRRAVRLRPGRGRVRRAAAGDPRLGPARLPAARGVVEPAKADSLWQLVVLQGAVGEAARADVLAYAAPTYYGMLVAEMVRRRRRAATRPGRP